MARRDWNWWLGAAAALFSSLALLNHDYARATWWMTWYIVAEVRENRRVG